MKYSILCSHFEPAFNKLQKELNNLVPSNPKVVVLPLAFPVETNYQDLEENWINPRRNEYLEGLYNLGIKPENISIINCYRDSKEDVEQKIKDSNILVIPGGNPEMLYYKLVMEYELLYILKYYEWIIIGESAGACTQFREYFITKENNYHGYKAWYPGFGVLNDPYYIDVHTRDDDEYLKQLQKIANKRKKIIYALHEEDSILHNRDTGDFNVFGNINIIKPE